MAKFTKYNNPNRRKKIHRRSENSKRTFEEFLKIIHAMTMADYEALNDYQKKAAEIDYINRYGAPIKWF